VRWCDAPREYGPARTLYNRWKRWSDNGVFARILTGLAAESAESKTIMIDATYLKAHRTASSLRAKKGAWTPDRAQCDDQETLRWIVSLSTGGMNTKLHAVPDAKGRPIRFFMSARQVSDHTGAAALLGSLPKAEWLQADRGYDADRFKDALEDKGIKPCIPGRASRKKTVRYDKRKYKHRNRIEILFGPLKDWPIVGKTVHRTVF
jgi:transposase